MVTYNLNLPNPPNDPSNDVSGLQVNTNSIATWSDVDHVGYNVANGGQHKFVTLPANVTPATPLSLASAVYTAPGTASNSTSQLFYVNGQGGGTPVPFQLSGIRAWVIYAGTGPANYVYSMGQLPQSSNIVSVSINASNTATITMATNAVSSAVYAVIATPLVINTQNVPITLFTTNLAPTTFNVTPVRTDINPTTAVSVSAVCLMVLQI